MILFCSFIPPPTCSIFFVLIICVQRAFLSVLTDKVLLHNSTTILHFCITNFPVLLSKSFYFTVTKCCHIIFLCNSLLCFLKLPYVLWKRLGDKKHVLSSLELFSFNAERNMYSYKLGNFLETCDTVIFSE